MVVSGYSGTRLQALDEELRELRAQLVKQRAHHRAVITLIASIRDCENEQLEIAANLHREYAGGWARLLHAPTFAAAAAAAAAPALQRSTAQMRTQPTLAVTVATTAELVAAGDEGRAALAASTVVWCPRAASCRSHTATAAALGLGARCVELYGSISQVRAAQGTQSHYTTLSVYV